MGEFGSEPEPSGLTLLPMGPNLMFEKTTLLPVWDCVTTVILFVSNDETGAVEGVVYSGTRC